MLLGLFRKRRPKIEKNKIQKKTFVLELTKRQKFLISVIIVSISLFISQFQYSSYGLIIWLVLAILCDILLYVSIRNDLPRFRQMPYAYSIFILPFFYTIAFGFFYYLVPTRILSRLILTLIYAVGLYSLYLSQNIFTIGFGKSIQLLTGARLVSFVITLITFFFLTNVVFSLHYNLFLILPIIFVYSFLLIFQSLYNHAMQTNSIGLTPVWSLLLAFCISQMASFVWLWPSSPTVIALFMTGFLYIVLGLSHVWFDRKLFRGVIWEFVWIGTIIFLVLLSATRWGNSS